MDEKKKFVILDSNGKEVECEPLFTFESEEVNKNYVVFYEVGQDDEEGIEVMAASYVPTEDGIGELSAIETDEEWELVEEVLQQFDEECDCEEGGDECGEGCACHHHE